MECELGFEIEIDEKKAKRGSRPASDPVCTGAELAEWLSVSPAAITKLKQKGILSVNADGMYNLKASIQSYVRQLRGRKEPQGQKIDLEANEDFWKTEDRKQRVLSWRVRYGSELTDKIMQQLTVGIGNLREVLKDNPKGVEAVKGMLQAIGNINVYDIVYEVSGYLDYGFDSSSSTDENQ